jgi:hypothetical protein
MKSMTQSKHERKMYGTMRGVGHKEEAELASQGRATNRDAPNWKRPISDNNPNRTPSLRRRPRPGTVVRMPLANGMFGYGCVTQPIAIRIYGFLATKPAARDGFFSREHWKFAARLGDLPSTFVNCGREALDGPEWGPDGYNPQFYEELAPNQASALGFRYVQVVSERNGYRELSPEEILAERRHKRRWLEWNNYNEVFDEWRPQMEIREVPPEFIDKKAQLGESVTAKALPPQVVELVVVFQLSELETEDPELEIEEPLEEALGEAECGAIGGSGTAPGVFEINLDTTRSDLKRCLSVIRRVLKKLKVPSNTIIRQLADPEIDHPLEPPPMPSSKKRTK